MLQEMSILLEQMVCLIIYLGDGALKSIFLNLLAKDHHFISVGQFGKDELFRQDDDSVGGLHFVFTNHGQVLCWKAEQNVGVWLGLFQRIVVVHVLQFPHIAQLWYISARLLNQAQKRRTKEVSVSYINWSLQILNGHVVEKLVYRKRSDDDLQSSNYINFYNQRKKVNKMAEYGYDKELFPNLAGDMFDCPICTNVVRKPKECTGCGDLFCARCIDDWTKKNNSCPKRCQGVIQFMTSPALKRIYEGLDIKCANCSKLVSLGDIDNHKLKCGRPQCWNTDICKGYEDREYGKSCSSKCQILQQLLTGGNVKQMYDLLKKYQPVVANQRVGRSLSTGRDVSPSNGGDSVSGALRWNQSNCGQGLKFQQGGQVVILKEAAYVFRTAIASSGFSSGAHYWEIIPSSLTQNELKIGVSTTTAFDYNTAFCDHVFGFAYYGLGQLRHSSNASGPQYGKRLKKEGVLGVFLDMTKGKLSFSLNGENMGVAYENAALKSGTIYPAVALLHCAGCTITGEKPIPACFK